VKAVKGLLLIKELLLQRKRSVALNSGLRRIPQTFLTDFLILEIFWKKRKDFFFPYFENIYDKRFKHCVCLLICRKYFTTLWKIKIYFVNFGL